MEKLLEFSMCGSEGEACNPYRLTAPIERQRLLLLINSKPMNVEGIAKELGMAVDEVVKHLEELARCGLVKKENGLYRPAFAIFTIEDQRILKPLIDELVDDVVRIVELWIPEFRRVIESFAIVRRGLRFPDLEYIAIGALALDYQGLDVLSEEGLLIKSKKMPGGGEYVFTGFEVGLFNLREAWMWGHHSVFGRYWFNTHGKLPPRGKRFAFPDLAWFWYVQGVDIDRIVAKMVEIGNILSALLREDLSFRDLQRELGVDSIALALDLSLLLAMNYVSVVGRDLWRLNIPVLTAEDYEALKQVSSSLLRDIAAVFKKKLNRIREAYSKTAPARNNIPVEEAFNQIYHLVFEQALNELMSRGIIAEPMERIDRGKYSAFVVILPESRPSD